MIGNLYESNEKKILDLGYSDGFGTYYVTEQAKSVLSVDFNKEAIEYAKMFNRCHNIDFNLENFLNKRYGDFDGIVSFDTIEHIYPENQKDYMKTVIMNLNVGGIYCRNS